MLYNTNNFILYVSGVFLRLYILLFALILISPDHLEGKPPSDRSFLWKISDKDSSVYILGSIHAVNDSVYPLHKRIEKAYRESDILVVEADIMANLNEESFEKVFSYAVYMDDRTLKEEVGEDLYSKVINEAKKTGFGMLEELNYMKPWFAGAALLMHKLAGLGYDPLTGIDLYFLKKSANNKPVKELESIDYQLDLLNGMSTEFQVLFLKQVLQESTTMKVEMEKLIKAWSAGDSAALARIILKTYKDTPEFEPLYDELIVKRNIRMSEKIAGYLDDNITYFIIIGAGHLVGNDGIITILRNKKYIISQQ